MGQAKSRLMIKLILHIFLILIALLTFFPFYWAMILGTQSTNEIYGTFSLLPGKYLKENFSTLLQSGVFFSSYINSAFVAILSTALTVFFSSLAGYAFAKYQFRGQNFLFAFVMFTMMVPVQLGLIAYVIEMRILGLSQSLFSLILPSIANAYSVFWMRQFIKSAFPTELIESAKLDGCGHFRIFIQIAVPIIKSGMFSIALISFVSSWNSYLLPSTLLNKPELYTLPLMIANLRGMFRVDYGAQFLGIALGILPLLIVFSTNSRRFITGLTAGALKE